MVGSDSSCGKESSSFVFSKCIGLTVCPLICFNCFSHSRLRKTMFLNEMLDLVHRKSFVPYTNPYTLQGFPTSQGILLTSVQGES